MKNRNILIVFTIALLLLWVVDFSFLSRTEVPPRLINNPEEDRQVTGDAAATRLVASAVAAEEARKEQEHIFLTFDTCFSKESNHLAIAGLFNTGSTLLFKLLKLNCLHRDIRYQVPWGKHNPSNWRETVCFLLICRIVICPVYSVRGAWF
jgi:hypothetical protein